MQTFTTPVSGDYKLEVWGAQGGDGGGKGGYACGYKVLNMSNNLYICVGCGHNNSILPYNGGGVPWVNLTSYCLRGGFGGGASHIASTNRGELKYYINNQSEVLLVAGGGGGSDFGQSGGAGGGESGIQGSYANSQGTSSSGGISMNNYGTTIALIDGSFGQGGYAIGTWNGEADNGGCGGGGWYGGGGSATAGAGGGGSGHINTTLITNGATIAGDQTFPSPSGGTETGHSGDGYAIITWRQLPPQ